MARHEGRRGDTPPGPGAGEHPAAGTAPVPTPSAVAPTVTATHPPAITVEAMIALANEVCGLYARAEVARAMAAHAASEAEQVTLTAHAGEWDDLVNDRWTALVAAIQTALPDTARIEPFMPVRPLSNGHVELHAHDTSARRLVVLLTGVQALAVGAHLTAYGAVSLDRTGQKLDRGLPSARPASPFTTAASIDSAEPTAARP
ncbi:hypothetical protein [Phytohabitans houttuyneae]|uniref:Uncharacterized protein n=1 Tax=Phytohabitans houttuyneae TaxID=1076126 RepID=A0A6V8KID7_9ACTN|nr:hypothetical protein [Phytohabitans houttuyneae]GFJ84962.1 hypothetical protein Phou_091420 [Phytohabitans houttuyneae]